MAEPLALALPDGRRLCCARYGAVAGPALFALHGTPGSRHMYELADAAARRLGLRLFAPDRPGFGDSDHRPGRVLADHADDLAALADHLELGRFGLLGISGGGLYAALAARRLAPRAAALGLVSAYAPGVGVGVAQRALLRMARLSLPLTRLSCGLIAGAARSAPGLSRRMLSLGARGGDRRALRDPELCRCLNAGMDGIWRDPRGAAREIELFAAAAPDFLPSARVPDCPTRIWHGTADAIVRPEAALRYACAFPDAVLELVPGAGHYWGLTGIAEVLEVLYRSLTCAS